MRIAITCWLFLWLSFWSNAQGNDEKISSLKNQLEKAVTDEEKVEVLLELYRVYLTENSKLAYTFLQEARNTVENLSDINLKLTTLQETRNYYEKQRIPSLVVEYDQKLIQLYEQKQDSAQLFNTHLHLADTYFSQENYEKALEIYLQLAKLGNRPWGKPSIAKIHNSIGLIFRNRRNFEEAARYFMEAKRLAQVTANKVEEGNALNNIGGNYYLSGDYENALEYFKQSYTIREEIGNQLLIAKSLNNIALVYNKLNRPELSLRRYHRSLAILTEANAINELPVIYDNLGDLHLKKNNFDSALYYHQQSLIFAQKVGNKVMIEDAYYSLSQTYEKMKEYKQAYDYLMKSYLMKDSIFDDLRSKQISEMQAKYDAELKETEILNLRQSKAISDLKLKNKEIIMYAGLIVAGIVLVLLFSIYKRSRMEREVNIKLNEQYQEISRQKQEIELQRDEIKRTHEQIQSSIKYAQRIQNAILPREEEINNILPEHFLIFRPRDVVSGDFYWVHQVDDKKVIVVADCTGHGVPGAFMSMIGNELLNEIVSIKQIHDPSRILTDLNKGIRRALKQEDNSNRDGMDVAICVLDEKEKNIEYAGAKNPVVYIENNELFQIKGNRNPVGGIQKNDEQPYDCHRFSITENTVVYLYTDGFQDQFGGERDKRLGAKRFKELLLKNHKLPMVAQKNELEKILLTWMGNSPQTDDITILAFKLSENK